MLNIALKIELYVQRAIFCACFQSSIARIHRPITLVQNRKFNLNFRGRCMMCRIVNLLSFSKIKIELYIIRSYNTSQLVLFYKMNVLFQNFPGVLRGANLVTFRAQMERTRFWKETNRYKSEKISLKAQQNGRKEANVYKHKLTVYTYSTVKVDFAWQRPYM